MILPLTFQHIAAVTALEKKCFRQAWNQEDWQRWFKNPFFLSFGILQKNDVVAYISLYIIQDEVEVLNLATDPAFRRQGLARHLLAYIKKQAGQWGVRYILLEVRQNNSAAIALYESFNFCHQGRRRAYYQDTGEDAILMRLSL